MTNDLDAIEAATSVLRDHGMTHIAGDVVALCAEVRELRQEVARLTERREGCCRCSHPRGCQCENDE